MTGRGLAVVVAGCLVSVGLIVAGVASLWGWPWASIAAGVLLFWSLNMICGEGAK